MGLDTAVTGLNFMMHCAAHLAPQRLLRGGNMSDLVYL
jgi:hypothetical protein